VTLLLLVAIAICIAMLLAAVLMLVLRELERAWDARRRRQSRRYWR